MTVPVLLNHTKIDSFKLKNDLQDICNKISVHHLDHSTHTETCLFERSIFFCKTEKDTNVDIVEKAMRISSESDSTILFIISEPDESFFDIISTSDKALYIKEPYTRDELKYKIKEASNTLNKSNDNFHMIADSIHDIIFTMDTSGKFFYVSPSVKKITGFTQEETLKKNMKELVTKQSFEHINSLMGTFLSKLQKGLPIKAPVIEMEILCKDDSTLWTELTVNPVFDEDQKFKSFTGVIRDINDRKKAEERFRIAAECTSDLIYEWNIKTDHLEWYGDIDEALGYNRGEVMGSLEAWLEKVHPDDLQEVMEKIENYRKTGDLFHAEYRILTKDGKIKYWKEQGIPIFDDVTKEVVRTIGVCSDITERKKAEDSLKESEEMFRLIAENANDVIWMLDARGNTLYVSPSVENLRGFTLEELKNLPTEERFTPQSFQDLMKLWNAFFSTFKKGFLPEVPRTIELEQPCKDGSTLWVEMHINPVLDNEGNFKFFLGISRNIDKRKKNELELEKQAKLLDTIFDLAPIPMVLVNRNGIVENINQECMEITKLEKEKSIGKKPGEIFSCVNASKGNGCGTNEKCTRCIFYTAAIETLKTRNNIHKREGITTIKLPDGSQLELNILVSTACIDLHDDVKIIYSVEDITERKRAEKAILMSKMEAEEANRTKSEFLATMSHELRTPLNAIIGYSQMLQEDTFGELNTKQNRFANNVSSSGKHLLELINDILDLSKVEAGKIELHFEEFDVNDVMRNVYNIISPLARKKHIDINFQVLKNTRIYADKTRFKQISYNLISNAVKFTPEKGHVEVSVTVEDKLLQLSVIDNGIGMDKEEQDKLFTPFYQVDSSMTRKYQGTGLGLSIVKNIVELHKGTIEVKSEAGKGSTFTIKLPRK
ncbi:PAS domain-containing sensor histidine kinase [Methanolobus sp.]|jgi:PAS domain S-box-containing protein|uniref:PAS domain-containing sensor histidine kinase n=1 Tax=Methanolobus sp. TaxID=1874737 RepID=UPI0025D19044|nr:PAS domain-containing sensor histidine kinase [Methanolobus sp.]